MAQTPEGRVKDAVKALLKRYKCYQFWPVQTGYGASTLDCIGAVRGQAFAVETKAGKAKLTARQEVTRDEMTEPGADMKVFVVRDKDTLATLKGWLDEVCN
jgi:hypothetical protein